MRRGIAMALGAFAAALLLVGCSYIVGWAGTRGNGSGADGPGTIIANASGVAYYPACGNEILEYDGTTWYPFVPTARWHKPVLDGPTAVASAMASGASGGRGIGASVPMVVAPGPGDDTGNLVIFEGGIAYFQSDSRNVDTWLTTVPQEYTWAC